MTPTRGAPVLAVLLFILPGTPPVSAQHPETSGAEVVEGADFQVYTSSGEVASLAEVLAEIDGAEAVLVGETHDDMVGHGFQLALLARVFDRLRETRTITLSLEMFEADVQYIVDEYLAGLISEDHFLRSSRPWPEYETRYRPMVEFARVHDMPIVASNAPRRYVNRVTREGPESLEALPETARRYLPPLPFPGPSEAYREQWDAEMAEGLAEMRAAMDSVAKASGASQGAAHGPARHYVPNPNQIFAQALWDAAMGSSLAESLSSGSNPLVLHMVGSFHVAHGTGIPERLVEYRPESDFFTVVMLPVEDVFEWDESYERAGDYVVLTKKPAEQADASN